MHEVVVTNDSKTQLTVPNIKHVRAAANHLTSDRPRLSTARHPFVGAVHLGTCLCPLFGGRSWWSPFPPDLTEKRGRSEPGTSESGLVPGTAAGLQPNDPEVSPQHPGVSGKTAEGRSALRFSSTLHQDNTAQTGPQPWAFVYCKPGNRFPRSPSEAWTLDHIYR